MTNEEFQTICQSLVDYRVDVTPVTIVGETMMCVCAEEGAIYITKEQAMKFFGLVEAETLADLQKDLEYERTTRHIAQEALIKLCKSREAEK